MTGIATGCETADGAAGASPDVATPQQPATRQVRSRGAESGAGSLPFTFDALQIGEGKAAARPEAIEPRNSAPTSP